MEPRAALSRSAVVAAGRRLVEAEGGAALSMRRVAAELGRSPMALYRHVADKRELLILVLDDVAGGVLPAIDALDAGTGAGRDHRHPPACRPRGPVVGQSGLRAHDARLP